MLIESTYVVIVLMALVVLFTRVIGYVLGLGIRNTKLFQPVLEVLPGCAMMALIVPGLMRGSAWEVGAVLIGAGVMWKTGSVVWATLIGLALLMGFNHLSGFF